jgi:hypothetical protein
MVCRDLPIRAAVRPTFFRSSASSDASHSVSSSAIPRRRARGSLMESGADRASSVVQGGAVGTAAWTGGALKCGGLSRGQGRRTPEPPPERVGRGLTLYESVRILIGPTKPFVLAGVNRTVESPRLWRANDQNGREPNRR